MVGMKTGSEWSFEYLFHPSERIPELCGSTRLISLKLSSLSLDWRCKAEKTKKCAESLEFVCPRLPRDQDLDDCFHQIRVANVRSWYIYVVWRLDLDWLRLSIAPKDTRSRTFVSSRSSTSIPESPIRDSISAWQRGRTNISSYISLFSFWLRRRMSWSFMASCYKIRQCLKRTIQRLVHCGETGRGRVLNDFELYILCCLYITLLGFRR